MLAGISDATGAVERYFDGNGNYAKGGVAIATAPAAGAVFNLGALTYAIKGLYYAKVAATNLPMSTTGPVVNNLALPIYTQPASSTVYYSILADASGNITTVQGDVNGKIPPYSMVNQNSGAISGVSIAPTAVQRLMLPPAPGQSPILTPVGGYTTLTVTTASAHGLQNGDTVQLNGILNSNINGQTFDVTVTSNTTFTIDNLDATMVGAAPGVGVNATFLQADAGRCFIGYIKVTTNSSTTFTPGVTLINAAGLTVSFVDACQVPINGRP